MHLTPALPFPRTTLLMTGVKATPLADLGLATVMARKGRTSALREALRTQRQIELPGPNRSAIVRDMRVVSIAPDAWLVVMQDADALWAGAFAQDLASIASVADQSSGYAVIRLSGPGARALLQSGLPIDLHPDMFPGNSAVVSVIAHLPVTCWVVDTECFDIAVGRSLAEDFLYWLKASTASEGKAAALTISS